MSNHQHLTYPPLNTLKPVAPQVWVADGPVIEFGFFLLKVPFPTRMTVMCLDGGALFIHSPTPLTPTLKGEIEKLGTPRWIVGPNRLHYWWIPEWKAFYPQAEVYLAPRTKEQAGTRINFPAHELARSTGYPWDGSIGTVQVPGSYMTEFDFFHRASRTLILTDLIENFEPKRLGLLMRWLTWFGRVQDPDGQMPRDMRWTYSQHENELRQAIETMIAWEPQRIIIAHGRWYDCNGADELRRAFRWLLNSRASAVKQTRSARTNRAPSLCRWRASRRGHENVQA